MSIPYTSRQLFLTITVFWLVFLAIFVVKTPLDGITGSIIELRSEYTVLEQLSKFYLLLMLLVALHAFNVESDSTLAKLGLFAFALAQTLYLGESNMITEKSQPFFAAFLLLPIFYWLWRRQLWTIFGILVLGFAIVGYGVGLDAVESSETLKSILPAFTYAANEYISEEIFDVVGISTIFLSMLLLFNKSWRTVAVDNKSAFITICIAAALISIGNGLVHFQYKPDDSLRFVGLFFSAVGWISFILANRHIQPAKTNIKLGTDEMLYGYLFVLYVLLPMHFGDQTTLFSLVLWLPMLLGLVAYLYRGKFSASLS